MPLLKVGTFEVHYTHNTFLVCDKIIIPNDEEQQQIEVPVEVAHELFSKLAEICIPKYTYFCKEKLRCMKIETRQLEEEINRLEKQTR